MSQTLRRPLRAGAAAACAVTAAAGLLATMSPAAFAAPVGPQQITPPKADPYLVDVKFRDNTDVTATGDAISLGTATAQARIDAIIGGAKSDSIEPLIDIPASKLDARREKLQNAGKKVPDLTTYVRVRIADDQNPAAALAKLKADPLVEEAYVVPAKAPAPVTPDFSSYHANYWGAAPAGLGISAASSTPGALGNNVKVVDLEYGFNKNHEDLVRSPATVTDLSPTPVADDDHGTAVAGIVAAKRDGIGINGIAPNVTYGFYSESQPNRATSMLNAAATMGPGDVMILEQQTSGPTGSAHYVAAEWEPSVYDATRTVTAAGIIVVAAAGNGINNGGAGIDTDGSAFAGQWPGSKPNSGAIIVGAGNPTASCDTGTAARSRLYFSSYGSRVDVQAPGRCVVSTGYGSLFGTNANDKYRESFGGTSSASAVTGGVVAALSSAYEQSTGSPLTPEAARNALVQSGSAQVAGAYDPPTGAKIGPQLNLPGAISYLNGAPNTTVTGGPTGYSSSTTPTFAFSSPTAGVTGYECRIVPVGGSLPSFGACSGATSHQPAALPEGDYRFEVRAKIGSNFDPTPATRSFGIGTGVEIYSGTQLNIKAFPGQSNSIKVRSTGSTYTVTETINNLKAGTGCLQVTAKTVSCTSALINFVSVSAGDGTDSVDVDTPNDSFLSGGDGNDVLRAVGAGQDALGGGAGNDTATYTGYSGAVNASIDGSINDGPVGGTPDFVGADIENLNGGDGNDTLTGGTAFAKLRGNAGNDALNAGAGGANLDGGSGNDTLQGGSASNDRADYSTRSDDLSINAGAPGSVTISSLSETDTIVSGIEEYAGGSGDDDISDSGANEKFYGNAGADYIVGVAGGNDTFDGGDGDDQIVDGAGDDITYAGDGQDKVTVFATGGSDEIYGGNGTDTVSHEFFSSGITATTDNVKNDGVPGVTAQLDNIHSDVETLVGGSGNDTLVGNAITSTLDGKNGNDTFISATGSGVFYGGAGTDKIDFSGRSASLTLSPLDPVAKSMYVNIAGGGFVGFFEMDHVVGTAYNDTLVAGDGTAGEPSLIIDGIGGNDALTGGAGNDTLIGGPGTDSFAAGAGNDSVQSKDTVAETADCGSGTDTAVVDGTDATIGCETITY